MCPCPFPASWLRGGRSDQDEFADEFRTVECDLLRDHSADRETEEIDLRQSETIDERFGVVRHSCKRRRHFAGRTRDTRIIEDNDLTILGKPIQKRRVPVVEISGEVLVKDKGQTTSLAPAPISEANTVGLNKLGGNCRRCIRAHGLVLIRKSPNRIRVPGLLSRNRRRSAPWVPRSLRSPRQSLRPP